MSLFCFLSFAIITFSGCVQRSESDVVVYAALDREFALPILASFERSTEGQTKVIAKYAVESTQTVGLVNSIISEKENPNCDLFWNNEILHTVRLQKLGLLEPRKWKLEAGYPTSMVASDGSWCGFAARARVLLVNTDIVGDKRDYPNSVFDLTDPRWSKNCAIAKPLFGTTAAHFAVLRESIGRQETVEMLRKIRQNAVVLTGNKQVALAVSSGQVAWGLTDTDDAIIQQDQGRNVAIVFPDQATDQAGTLRIPNTIAILKNAPHPVAAGILADHLVRPETENRLAMGDSSQLPISRESTFPPRVMPEIPIRWMMVDFEKAADGWEPWADELRELFE